MNPDIYYRDTNLSKQKNHRDIYHHYVRQQNSCRSHFYTYNIQVQARHGTGEDYQKTEYPGIITFKVPQGKHLIETSFTENTPARRFGNITSLIGLVSFLIILETGWLLKPKKS